MSTKVLLRDGLSLILCEFILILLINGPSLYWWQGLILMGMYLAYLIYMLTSMKAVENDDPSDDDEEEDEDGPSTPFGKAFLLAFRWIL